MAQSILIVMLDEATADDLEAVARARGCTVEDAARDLLEPQVAIEKRKADLGIRSVALPPR